MTNRASELRDLPHRAIWLHDFEFITSSGNLPDVVCLCARELRTGQTIRAWRGEGRDELITPPYAIDDDALFVSFVANAEMLCHLALGWPLPRHVLDLSPLFRNYINGRERPASGVGLIGALEHFRIPSIGGLRKDAMRNRILQGRPFADDAERSEILDYCMSDVDALEKLAPNLLPTVDLSTALHWGEAVAVLAAMEHRGVPIDMEIFSQLQDRRTWARIRDAIVPEINARYGVYVQDRNGEWHLSMANFVQYCARAQIGWPCHAGSDKPDMGRECFNAMAKVWPQLEPLRQLRHMRDQMRAVKLAVGHDGRNRTTLWPFAAKTARTQPKASLWIFSPAVWLRSLIKPGPGQAVAYIDYSSMEFQIAAALSRCQPMLELYATGSPYLEFAKRFDQAPRDATKKTHEDVHQRYKVSCLGAQYGMQFQTLSLRLGVPDFVAYDMLGQHRGLFNRFWAWTDDWIAHALDSGVMWTAMGWTGRTGITELNARSIGNWPIQSTGADILRLACVWGHRRGIKICAPIHDAVLIENSIERIEADVTLMQEIMRRASRVVLSGYELRTDATIVRYPDRYSDKRGVEMWARVLRRLDHLKQQEMAHAG
jgi:DNA polymerase-1